MDDAQVAQIARGLSKAQETLLMLLPQRASLINGAPGRELYRKGLATLVGRLVPTSEGLAVRRHLEQDHAE